MFDASRDLVDFVAYAFMGSRQRLAQHFHMANNFRTLCRQFTDQTLEADFRVSIGTLKASHFRGDETFEFTRSGKGALHSIADRGDFAAYRRADHGYGFRACHFGLQQPDGCFRHGAGGNAHFLRPAHDRGESPDHRERHQQYGTEDHHGWLVEQIANAGQWRNAAIGSANEIQAGANAKPDDTDQECINISARG